MPVDLIGWCRRSRSLCIEGMRCGKSLVHGEVGLWVWGRAVGVADRLAPRAPGAVDVMALTTPIKVRAMLIAQGSPGEHRYEVWIADARS